MSAVCGPHGSGERLPVVVDGAIGAHLPQLPLHDLARLDDLGHIQGMPCGRQPAGRKDMRHTRRDTGGVVAQAGRERAVKTNRFRRVEQVPGRGRAVAIRGHPPRGAGRGAGEIRVREGA